MKPTIPQKRLLKEANINAILNLFHNPGTPGEKEAARNAYIKHTGQEPPSKPNPRPSTPTPKPPPTPKKQKSAGHNWDSLRCKACQKRRANYGPGKPCPKHKKHKKRKTYKNQY